MRRKNTEDRDLFFSFPFNSHTGGPTVLVYVCTWIYIFTEVGVARVLLLPSFTRHAVDKSISPKKYNDSDDDHDADGHCEKAKMQISGG